MQRLRATLGTPAAFRGLLQDFLASSARLAGDLQVALARGRFQDLARAAHTLKSMARILGATELAETCRSIEVEGRSPTPNVPRAKVQEAVTQVALTRRAVERLLQ